MTCWVNTAGLELKESKASDSEGCDVSGSEGEPQSRDESAAAVDDTDSDDPYVTKSESN